LHLPAKPVPGKVAANRVSHCRRRLRFNTLGGAVNTETFTAWAMATPSLREFVFQRHEVSFG